MKSRDAHPCDPRKFSYRQRLGEVLTEMSYSITNMTQDTVSKADLRNALSQRSPEEPPENLLFDERREGYGIDRIVEQSEHPDNRIEKLIVGGVSANGYP